MVLRDVDRERIRQAVTTLQTDDDVCRIDSLDADDRQPSVRPRRLRTVEHGRAGAHKRHQSYQLRIGEGTSDHEWSVLVVFGRVGSEGPSVDRHLGILPVSCSNPPFTRSVSIGDCLEVHDRAPAQAWLIDGRGQMRVDVPDRRDHVRG
jgi:hypothetical protein